MFQACPVEVGIGQSGRCTLELRDATVPAPAGKPLQTGDVVVVTGGARGVTADASLALARAFCPTLVLLGRSAAPDPEPAWLVSLTSEADIKRALQARAQSGTPPRVIGEQYQAVLARREVRQNLERIAAAGATVHYKSLDVRDRAAVTRTLAEIRTTLGPIRGLVHGAGVLADRRIEDKTAEQFDYVYDTKVAGLRALLAELEKDDLRVLALFSSSTGRFGRVGQVDYAAANEVLNKLAQEQARRRPGCRVVAVNWGPWEGGMVTPALQKVFAQEGIGLIALEDGGRYLVAELSAPGPVEVVVLGRHEAAAAPSLPTVPASSLNLVLERDIDLVRHPVLRAHVFGGRPVVPLALLAEWLGHAALHGNPGLKFHGLDNLRVLHGLALDGGRPARMRLLAGKGVKRDGLLFVPAEVRGVAPDGREVPHTRADVVLAADLPAAESPVPAPRLAAYMRTPSTVYTDVLFHGPELHALDHIEGCGPEGIIARLRCAPPPRQWLTEPFRGGWLADPLVLDGAFQAMIVWSESTAGVLNLPSGVECYRQYRRAFPTDGVRAVARITHSTGGVARADVDCLDSAGRLIARIQGLECVLEAALAEKFRNNQVVLS
jgi:NAD(P)-dependent dehydrogenase (short-subunit alcohol dehydrogenase family)/acyl-coenzyme A thioesterase PaaI-like protein